MELYRLNVHFLASRQVLTSLLTFIVNLLGGIGYLPLGDVETETGQIKQMVQRYNQSHGWSQV